MAVRRSLPDAVTKASHACSFRVLSISAIARTTTFLDSISAVGLGYTCYSHYQQKAYRYIFGTETAIALLQITFINLCHPHASFAYANVHATKTSTCPKHITAVREDSHTTILAFVASGHPLRTFLEMLMTSKSVIAVSFRVCINDAAGLIHYQSNSEPPRMRSQRGARQQEIFIKKLF